MFKVKHNYDEIKELFHSLYLSERKGNRNVFIEEGLKLNFGLTEDELCLIWQAFDMATEHWYWEK